MESGEWRVETGVWSLESGERWVGSGEGRGPWRQLGREGRVHSRGQGSWWPGVWARHGADGCGQKVAVGFGAMIVESGGSCVAAVLTLFEPEGWVRVVHSWIVGVPSVCVSGATCCLRMREVSV